MSKTAQVPTVSGERSTHTKDSRAPPAGRTAPPTCHLRTEFRSLHAHRTLTHGYWKERLKHLYQADAKCL